MLLGLVEASSELAGIAARALTEALTTGLLQLDRLAIRRADGQPLPDSPWEAPLIDAGFKVAPKGLTFEPVGTRRR